ncbi:hypothetical protein [Paenibacillus sonchi]|uniref:hypothetical protein n=1 Tax=Paenibacillus sonchi TaxID=373687 RepID=UPI001E5E05DF|nr:hypothetical protein [Paenibacillus sonchi]MCE3199478.1 hypothetical protein [Paenibacillus sonchi]
MNKKLTVSAPYITTYPPYANIFSMIGSCKNSMNWFYNNFVDLKIEDDTIFFAEHPTLFGSCPWLSIEKLTREQIQLKWDSFVHFVIDCIDAGCYLDLTLDQSQIPNAKRTKSPFFHETLIFGYNRSQELIYIADNFGRGVYQTTECTFLEISRAYAYFKPDSYLGINKISVTEIDYNFDLEFVMKSMSSYMKYRLNSIHDASDVYSFWNNKIIRYSERNTLDIRDFHLLWSHKKCMLDRLDYMRENGHLDKERKYDDYIEIVKQSLIQLNFALKYLVTKDHKIVDRIICGNNQIRAKELAILERLFK